MKVLLVNGSPNEKGCTYTALSEIAKTLNEEGIETEIFWTGSQPLGGCIACLSCAKTGECVFDDAVNACRAKIYEADGFVFGTPVHFAGASGNMTGFMDRLFYSEGRHGSKGFYMKPAAAIVAARRAGATAALEQMNKYFMIRQMPVVSSNYWNMVHGAVAEEAPQDEEGMQTMRVLARNMAYLLRCIEAGRRAGVELPKKEEPIKTNFIR